VKQLLSPSVRLLRPVARKRGAPYVAAAPDFDFFTVYDFRAANGGLEPEQARSRARTRARSMRIARRSNSYFRFCLSFTPGAQFVEYQALVGDTVDNIPGVAGIGPTTAPGLLLRHGSLEALLAAAAASADAVEPKRAAKALAAPGAHDAARISAQLARLCCDVDVPVLMQPVDAAWRLAPPDDCGDAAADALAALEFASLVRRVQALWTPF
jgi:5'-3' exonuclease